VGEKREQVKGGFRKLLCATVAIGMALSMGACSRSPQIEVKGQEAILSPVLLGVCSIFMKIENSGNGEDTLLDAKVNIPNTVTELHDVQDGKMIKREQILIPAKSVVQLRPGRQHIMVFRLPKEVREDEEFILHLRFEKSGEKRMPVKFVKIDKPAR
jgi:copper(I)-binding protein